MNTIETVVKTDYLNAIKKDNPKLIRHVYSHFFPGIANYIQKHDGNKEDAEDIFADALEVIFLKVSKDELSIKCSFYTYLFEVCKRMWSKVKRRKKYTSKKGVDSEMPQASNDNFHLQYEQQEQYNLYQEKFQQLSPNSQQVLLLAIVERKSMAEIAKLMGYKSTGYARKRKHQCLQQLLTLIQKDSRYEELVN